jgi:uncharacterized membrane protein YvlD (DUF360 family)
VKQNLGKKIIRWIITAIAALVLIELVPGISLELTDIIVVLVITLLLILADTGSYHVGY